MIAVVQETLMLCPCCSCHQLTGDDELYGKAKRLAPLLQQGHSNNVSCTTPTSVISTFVEVCTALLLFLTLHVTGQQPSDPFSKMKLIKTYLRGSMGQERLNGLATLSIEKANHASPLLCLKGVVRQV